MIHQGELGVVPRQDMLHGVLHFHTSHDGIRNRRAAAREMSPSIAIAPSHSLYSQRFAGLGKRLAVGKPRPSGLEWLPCTKDFFRRDLPPGGC
jgi:hypothetical protein